MPNMNEKIHDLLIQHQHYLQMLGAGSASKGIKAIDKNMTLIRGQLYEGLQEIVDTKALTKKQSKLITSLAASIAGKRAANFTNFRTEFTQGVPDLVDSEAMFVQRMLDTTTPFKWQYQTIIVTAVAPRIVNYGVFAGKGIDQWFDDLLSVDRARILGTIRTGMAQGLDIPNMVRNLIGTRNEGYANGILQRSRNDVTSLCRTITNGVANTTRQEIFQANRQLIQKEQYKGTLDGRITLLCAGLDGNFYNLGEGPIPPLHVNCRSIRDPIVDMEWVNKAIGERPFVRDTRTRKFRQRDFRADAKREVGNAEWKKMSERQRTARVGDVRRAWSKANVGQVPGNYTYSQWFDRQPAGFQKDYLGPGRYELYSERKLSISQFTDNAGRMLTIKELNGKTDAMMGNY